MKNSYYQNKKPLKGISQVTNFLKVISDKNRLVILRFLTSGEKCVCEIWQNFGLTQNLASHHLKTLKDFGLISSRKEGLKVFYKLNGNILEKNIKSLTKFLT